MKAKRIYLLDFGILEGRFFWAAVEAKTASNRNATSQWFTISTSGALIEH